MGEQSLPSVTRRLAPSVGWSPRGVWEASFVNECFCCENTELSRGNEVSGEEFTAPASVLFSCVGSMGTHTRIARVCFYVSVWGNQDGYVGIIFPLLLN